MPPLLEPFDQCLDILFPRRPACRKAHDGRAVREVFPETHLDMLFQTLALLLIQHEEDLVCRRVEGEAVAFLEECAADAVGGADRRLAAFSVKVMGKECIELQSRNAPFCEECAVLLDDAEEVRHGVFLRKDDSFAEESAEFRPEDLEGGLETGDVG